MHNARVVWFDDTGRFNPATLGENVPQGFVIDYKNDIQDKEDENVKEYPFAKLKVALTIAFGHHGFENKFNEQNPFVIVVMAEDVQELENLKLSVSRFIDTLNIADETKKAVKVDGYLAKPASVLKQVA